MHILESTPVCLADSFENLVLASLVKHLRLLLEADAWEPVTRCRLRVDNSLALPLIVELLVTLPLLVVQLVLAKFRSHRVGRFKTGRSLSDETA